MIINLLLTTPYTPIEMESETKCKSGASCMEQIKNELNVQQETKPNPDEDLEIIHILAGTKDKILSKQKQFECGHATAMPIKTEPVPIPPRIDQLDIISSVADHKFLPLSMDQDDAACIDDPADSDYSIDDNDNIHNKQDERPQRLKQETMTESTDNRLPPSIEFADSGTYSHSRKMKIEPPSKPPPPAHPPLAALLKLKYESTMTATTTNNHDHASEQQQQQRPRGKHVQTAKVANRHKSTNSSQRSKKEYKCEYEGCEYATSNQAHLRKHLRIHTNERPFSCNICHKSFKQKSNLKTHIRIHTGQRPFECSTCHKRFTQRSSLVQHQKIHSGEKPFVCDYAGCNKRFKRKDHLKSHHRVHTGEKPEKCSFAGCSKSFATPQQLKLHYMDHTGVRPFSCSHPGCGKRFKTNSLLTRQKVTHSAIKPFICSLCNKGFSRKIHFSKHKCLHNASKATTSSAKSNQFPPRL